MLASVDSGPAHLAAAVGTPVLGLYSGTNLASQWGVRGKRSRILRAATPCSPCELTACPYGNECMRRLSVGQALAAARGLA
jgi:ADP-heptose:LPS heptosyltransferase